MKNEVKTVAEWEAAAERLTEIKGWVCKTCRRYHGDAPESARHARYCCTQTYPCPCGGLARFGYTLCATCCAEADRQREEQRIGQAAVVAQADYDGPVFAEGFGDEYFLSVEALVEWLEYEFGEDEWRQHVPAVVWACDQHQIVRCIYAAATNNLSEEAHEEWDADRLHGVEAFQAACAAFEEANKGEVSWTPDFRRRVDVQWAPSSPLPVACS